VNALESCDWFSGDLIIRSQRKINFAQRVWRIKWSDAIYLAYAVLLMVQSVIGWKPKTNHQAGIIDLFDTVS
jgi:sulfite reductase (ferredoxin)